MAHPEDRRPRLRSAYVVDQLSLEIAAERMEIPITTARRWKRDAREDGDDWDKVRGAYLLAGGGIEEVMRQSLTAMIRQTQAVIEMLQADEGETITAPERVRLLASLGDSLNKMVAASRRIMPETDRLGVALEVLRRYLAFIRERYPHQASMIDESLQPFGEELVKVYG